MAAQGKVFVLTGASRGMGLAIAHYLLKQKCNLIVVSRSLEPLQKLESEYPSQVKALAGDLADSRLAKQAIEAATREWNRLDGLIANHGTLDPVKEALPSLKQSKGSIIITSSGASQNAYTGWGAYGAAKATLNHLVLSLGEEEPDVLSIAVRPGTVDTDMQRDIREKHQSTMSQKDYEKFSALKTTGKLLKPEQPGHVIAKLAIDAPKELSGKFLSWNAEDLKAYQG
ncbi:NAD(P)-binding protein [Pseudovirgaria hyperparasitica]|uniref:NAD(P)-binding protein n=1 Tax=Pseudovirgaria hyperparasitica TaxID=470096 RepID=A0A6A6WH00_9PEZI|nr:NAD(P)-binding protein [Pseudovirgaria hyperparasitica]KAF2761365.1 NAD(P)-binding protein [Pseudovirgaria hyperparasitica]